VVRGASGRLDRLFYEIFRRADWRDVIPTTGYDNMSDLERLRGILRDTLQLGPRAASLNAGSRLLGAIPEFDSMAVVNVMTMIEDEFGITIHDDEVSAEVFETLGTLADFVARKASR